MIVRNEAGVVTRLLDSVVPLIDYWVICDTGSCDGTPEVVEEYFQSTGIQGELHQHSWQDFGRNRTRALTLADGKADYILLLDADMVLHRSSHFDPELLTADSYTFRQDTGDLSYYNTRLVRSGLQWTCVGPTHEYYTSPCASDSVRLDGLWIEDIGDGGSKSNKFERDINLLENAVRNDPDNPRNYFYLGESYRNTGLMEKAVTAYEKRIELGGWDEETWYAVYMKGVALAALGRAPEASATFREALRHRPWRAEPLRALVELLRQRGRYRAAVGLAEKGRRFRYPENDVLFIERSTYDWRFDHELTICAFHADRKESGRFACERLLAQRDLPGHIRANVLQNLVSYVPTLADLISEPIIPQVLETSDPCWRYTNPSICRRNGGGYWLNLRQVDYRVTWPEYRLRKDDIPIDADHPITTENVLVTLDEDLSIVDSGYRIIAETDRVPVHPAHAQGYEDARVFYFQNSLHLSANTFQHSKDGLSRICLLKLGESSSASLNIARGYRDGLQHEKNWMPFVHNEELYFVYKCDPLTILKTDPETGHCIKVSEETPPICCAGFSGGSQGIRFDNGYLFVVHQAVEHLDRRTYLHRFVLIGEDFRMKTVSDAFYLNSPAIEFVAGLASGPSEESLVLSWGWNDEAALLARVSTRGVQGILRWIG